MNTNKQKEQQENQDTDTDVSLDEQRVEESATELKESESEKEQDQERIEELLKENANLKDQLLRFAAEFDNFRKRVERENRNLVEHTVADIISRLLPVLDDLERSIQATEAKEDENPLLEGVKLVHKNFVKSLTDMGLEPMQSVGKEFNPDKHDAMMQMKVEGMEPHLVVDEHVKGYLFRDKVIRHAKVIVSA
jgi:molecular chaperone GrpE